MSELESPALPPLVVPPEESTLELTRMRRCVRARVFGGAEEATRIGRFRLLECIGRGAMGVVWSAHDETLDRTVAIKLLRPEFSGREVTDEARALARLSHPNVVSVFDVGVHEAQRFIAMEYVQGETLRDWLRTPRSTSEVVAQFVGAGRGLAAAHRVGLVHRDFKPDNVLVGNDGRPRVLDFGLARAPDAAGGPIPAIEAGADPFSTTMTHAGLLVGTPAYMAPEQHLGEPAGPHSDQFAFAVALFEGLVGRLPFPADDLRTLSLRVVRGRVEPPPPGAVEPEVMAIVTRALSVEPRARFESLDAMLDALAAPTRDERFDTRAADAVLGRAASLAEASGRGLSAAELQEVAAEAGIEPRFARMALAEARAEVPAGIEVPSADEDDAVAVRRRLPLLRPPVADVLVQELGRRASGKARRLGASTVWESRRLEVHIDPGHDTTSLVLMDKPSALAKTRPIRYAALGWLIVVSTIVPVTVELLEPFEALIMAIIFPSMFFGVWKGWRFGKRRTRALAQRRRRALERTADRLVVLAEANNATAG